MAVTICGLVVQCRLGLGVVHLIFIGGGDVFGPEYIFLHMPEPGFLVCMWYGSGLFSPRLRIKQKNKNSLLDTWKWIKFCFCKNKTEDS